jgi:hypothetical protein
MIGLLKTNLHLLHDLTQSAIVTVKAGVLVTLAKTTEQRPMECLLVSTSRRVMPVAERIAFAFYQPRNDGHCRPYR